MPMLLAISMSIEMVTNKDFTSVGTPYFFHINFFEFTEMGPIRALLERGRQIP
jgi:hypothetical protein